MNLRRPIALLLAAVSTAALANEAVLYEGEGFTGRSWTLRRDNVDFNNGPFNDRIRSIRIVSGYWQFCTDAYFHGDCRDYGRGNYPSLGGHEARYSSGRLGGGPGWGPPGGGDWQGGEGEVVLYDRTGFNRPIGTLRGPTPNFEPLGFNDAAASIIVRRGTWQFCADANYRGECHVYGPGQYATLPGNDDRYSSARPVYDRPPSWPSNPSAPVRPPYPGEEPDWGGQRARLRLFDYPGFDGRTVVLDRANSNFDRMGFNDRAESMIVEGGEWRVCTDANYRGSCRTFPPGRYGQLPPGFRASVSSAQPR